MKTAVLVALVTIAISASLLSCGGRGGTCTPFHKGYPLCGL